MTDNDWTEWASLKKLDFTRITTTSGVYEIGASINGQPQPINRANDVDKNGLLYIGKAGNLRKRIKDFWIHIITEGNQHTAAETYLLYGFDTKFHKESLQVRWLALPKGMQEDFEIKLIDARARARNPVGAHLLETTERSINSRSANVLGLHWK